MLRKPSSKPPATGPVSWQTSEDSMDAGQAGTSSDTTEAQHRAQSRVNDRKRFAVHAAVFAALANPTRHEMMHVLCERPHTPSELAEELEVSRPNVSQHLAVLQREGLVRRTREDGHVLWSVVDPRLKQACSLIDEIVGRELAGKMHALGPVEQTVSAADGPGSDSSTEV
jgi:DNA-binding transcriptional ArsR family regulator